MTDTPKTDSEIEDVRNLALEFECGNPPPKPGENCYVVRADVARKLERELTSAILESRQKWIAGDPPLEKIVLLWNGKQMFGPISFFATENLTLCFSRMETMHGGRPTHHLIIPKCETNS